MYNPCNRKNDIKKIERVSIKEYLNSFIENFYPCARIRTNNPSQAWVIKEQANRPQNTSFKSLRWSGWSEQEIDYVPSNLGENRGVIFYFICNQCHRKVKYLYVLSYAYSPLCRVCSNLKYQEPTRLARSISKAINKNYMTAEVKYAAMKRMGITKNDIANYLIDNYKNEPGTK